MAISKKVGVNDVSAMPDFDQVTVDVITQTVRAALAAASKKIPCATVSYNLGGQPSSNNVIVSAGIHFNPQGYETQELSMRVDVSQVNNKPYCSWQITTVDSSEVIVSGSRNFSVSDLSPLEQSLRVALRNAFGQTQVNPAFARFAGHYLY